MKIIQKIGLFLISLLFLLFIGGGIFAVGVVIHYSKDLPDYRQLEVYTPAVTTRFYAGDGRLLAEYAAEKRVFLPIDDIPDIVKKAFISAEDQRFYSHSGIDPIGLTRAIISNLKNLRTDKRMGGASTITQQVAKNFLLTNERSIKRKIKEAIISFRMEKAFNKGHILELYLNEIYLGGGSYGVAAAAMNYFNKSVDELTLAEAAFLAALPKAPNKYNPENNYEEAKARRDWVISRMLKDGAITEKEADAAIAEPIIINHPQINLTKESGYFAEEVRRMIIAKYGKDSIYEGGLAVSTSVDPKIQEIAVNALKDGLIAYDKRHGYRGPLVSIDIGEHWQDDLKKAVLPEYVPENWKRALVTDVGKNEAKIAFIDGTTGTIPLAEVTWARSNKEDQDVGGAVTSITQVFKVGDIILAEQVFKDAKKKDYPPNTYTLRQLPDVEGALVAMDPHTGRVLAMAGGFSFKKSEFNRATQARRQPGSSFKPFVYLAALDQGFTPSSIILDAPFSMDQGEGKGKWRPQNYSTNFYGPTTLRVGLEKSRNLMTVRLANHKDVGMKRVVEYASKFGIADNLQPVLAMSLGSGETTLLRLTAAYSMLVNGGKKITPSLIDKIQDRSGKTIYKHDDRECPECFEPFVKGAQPPSLPDLREQLTDPMSAYQIVNMLTGVIENGTGRAAMIKGRPLAGKTGTTDGNFDAWFMGFSPDLAVGVFVGFDDPRTLGAKDTGGIVAAPIFRDFMSKVLAGKPPTPFRVPSGIKFVRVNHKTGLPAKAFDNDVILEAFKPGTDIYSPKKIDDSDETSYDESDSFAGDEGSNIPDVGGIY